MDRRAGEKKVEVESGMKRNSRISGGAGELDGDAFFRQSEEEEKWMIVDRILQFLVSVEYSLIKSVINEPLIMFLNIEIHVFVNIEVVCN